MLYRLACNTNRKNIWVLGHDVIEPSEQFPTKGHHLQPMYLDLVCPNCGKVDEAAALRRPLGPSVTVSSARDARYDFLLTNDGFRLVSRRFGELLTQSAPSFANLKTLPGENRFFLIDLRQVPTDPKVCWLRQHRPWGGTPYRTPGARDETPDHRCVVCNRVYEHTGEVTIAAMQVPVGIPAIFTSDFGFEDQRGRIEIAYATPELVTLMRAAELKGIDYMEIS